MITRRTLLGQAAAAAILGALAAVPFAARPAVAADRISVVATTGMIADAARQVGGDLVDVTALMGPGVDPHAYRQTRSDIVALARADLVLWHGLYLEAQMEEFMRDLERDANVVAVAEAMPRDLLISHDSYADKFDPHVWMVPALWTHVVAAVRDALIATRPEDEATFRANADAHLAEVEALVAYTTDILATVPDGPPRPRHGA